MSAYFTFRRMKLARLLCLWLLTLTDAAQAQFTYETNDGSITISRYDCASNIAVIPSTIDGVPVTAIGSHAFEYCQRITSVVIPDSITSIGFEAFYNCTNLNEVVIPDSVTYIWLVAFGNCRSLTSISIPDSVSGIDIYAFSYCTSLRTVHLGRNVEGIGDLAFSYCSSLESINVDPQNTVFLSDRGCLINKRLKYFSKCPEMKAGAYKIPEGITTIEGSAFYGCTRLTSIVIPKDVTTIGISAFYNCSNLTDIYFEGRPPGGDSSIFGFPDNVAIHYLPNTPGWGTSFAGRPTTLWKPMVSTNDPSFGVRSNQFGFGMNWAPDKTVIVEVSTSTINPVWTPVSTNIVTGGRSYFSDPQWTNYPSRLYRLRAP